MVISAALLCAACHGTTARRSASPDAPSASSDAATSYLTWNRVATSTAFPPREALSAVVFRGKMWVMAGGFFAEPEAKLSLYDDVWSSSDGASWTREAEHAGFSPRWGQSAVVYGDRIWLTGGQTADGTICNDVWSSADGVSWARQTEHADFAPRTYHGSTVFNDQMWVVLGGGDTDRTADVWSSTDGVAWARRTDEFIPRLMKHGVLVFDHRLWVLFGDNGSTQQFVASSIDGSTWTDQWFITGPGNRAGQCSLVYRDAMWVIGGYGNQNYHDVWYSTDVEGKRWSLDQAAAPFTERSATGCLVYDDQIWLLGGHEQWTGNVLDEVWRAQASAVH